MEFLGKSELKNASDKELQLMRNGWRGPQPSQEVFIQKLKLANLANFEWGVRQGWFEDFNEKEPIDFPQKIKLEDFPEGATTANLAARLGVFPSITQARKNNVNAPLTKGLHTFRKGQVRALII